MNNRLLFILIIVVLLLAGGENQNAIANNINITNVVLVAGGYTDYTYVQCDISWDHSWRASWLETNVIPNVNVTNWDAAWVFVKYRIEGGAWQRASLSTTNNEHVAPAGATINAGLSTNASGSNFGVGVFLYRSAEGSGSWTNTIKLRWSYAQDGVLSTSRVDVSVHTIEMVYVPQGSFYVGDGTSTSLQGQFENGKFTNALQIISEDTIVLGGGLAGSLGNNNTSGMATNDDFNDTTSQTLPPEYPKGYNAFYCTKYEISQGQWVDFFNMLTDDQKTNRDITGGVYNTSGKGTDLETNRNAVAWTTGDATCSTPDRACNFLSWADGVAYADWAGLRPMTELEYEKACRGPVIPVPNEYAWGNATITDTTGFNGTDGSGMETALPSGANCNYGNTDILGPVRVGIYATSTSGRIASGSTYWGVMEMSGNLRERVVTLGSAAGRIFTGAVGDGNLSTRGDADVTFWPDSSASGAAFRGGDWNYTTTNLRVSDRRAAAYTSSNRYFLYGFRAVRHMSSVVMN